MTRKFYKHKLLLDENVQNRTYFPSLNERFDVKHVVADYKEVSIPDEAVYELARKEGRFSLRTTSRTLYTSPLNVPIRESLACLLNCLLNRLI
jgi:hypothetical protein